MSSKEIKKQRKASLRARIYRAILSWYVNRIDVRSIDIPKTRKRLDFFAGIARKARQVSARKAPIANVPAEWLRPAGASNEKLLLYWHGGAYMVGSSRSHKPLVSHIASAAGVQAVIPEYRLAPEHRYPAAIDDAVRVYRQLLDNGLLPSNIVVAGDSAGGGLTVAMLLALREAAVPLPRATVLLSPWLDLTSKGQSMTTRRDRDPLFNPDDIPLVVTQYCDDVQLRLPRVSPVYANVAGLPQTLIQVGDDEVLLSDSERFTANLREAGVPVTLDVWPNMWHVWQMFVGLMPESRLANIKLGHFIRNVLTD